VLGGVFEAIGSGSRDYGDDNFFGLLSSYGLSDEREWNQRNAKRVETLDRLTSSLADRPGARGDVRIDRDADIDQRQEKLLRYRRQLYAAWREVEDSRDRQVAELTARPAAEFEEGASLAAKAEARRLNMPVGEFVKKQAITEAVQAPRANKKWAAWEELLSKSSMTPFASWMLEGKAPGKNQRGYGIKGLADTESVRRFENVWFRMLANYEQASIDGSRFSPSLDDLRELVDVLRLDDAVADNVLFEGRKFNADELARLGVDTPSRMLENLRRAQQTHAQPIDQVAPTSGVYLDKDRGQVEKKMYGNWSPGRRPIARTTQLDDNVEMGRTLIGPSLAEQLGLTITKKLPSGDVGVRVPNLAMHTRFRGAMSQALRQSVFKRVLDSSSGDSAMGKLLRWRSIGEPIGVDDWKGFGTRGGDIVEAIDNQQNPRPMGPIRRTLRDHKEQLRGFFIKTYGFD
ncbi:MAG: hypothetical protein ACR2J8_09200, partial [Thermomicrobiales bacterium]